MSTPNHVNAQYFGMHTPPRSPNPPRGPPTNMSGNHNPGGNGDQAPRPASFMRDGCIVRNGGGPPDETPPPGGGEPGGHWDEWHRNHGGGDGQNNGDWDGAESWAGSHPTGGGADPHWPKKWVEDMLADIRKHQVNREWQTIQLSPLPTVRTLGHG